MEEHPSSTKASAHSIAILILRLALGSIFFAHGAQKVFGAFEGRGIEGVIGMTTSFGLPMPVVMAWIVALIEFAGGIAVFIGFFTRIAAAGICINMIVAIIKVHMKDGFFACEFPLSLLAIALSLVVSGGGRISIDFLLYKWLGVKNRFFGWLLG
ncbi:MAG: DoxX family protein [Armatimonadota bacterium]